MVGALPVIPCPTCGRIISVGDSGCWACGSVFKGRELWEIYEEARWG